MSVFDLPVSQRVQGHPERYIADLVKMREKVDTAAKDALAMYYKRLKTDFDSDPSRKIGEHRLQVGTWVLVKILLQNPKGAKSLGTLYMGPAELMRLYQHAAEVVFLNNEMRRI